MMHFIFIFNSQLASNFHQRKFGSVKFRIKAKRMFWILLPAVGMLLMDKRTIVRFCCHNITHISKATDSRCFKKYQNRIQNPVEQLRQSFLRKYFQLGSGYASENFSLYFHRTLRIKSVKKSFFGINGIMEVKIMEIINNFSEHNYSLHSISTKSSCLWYFTVQLVSVLNLTLKISSTEQNGCCSYVF